MAPFEKIAPVSPIVAAAFRIKRSTKTGSYSWHRGSLSNSGWPTLEECEASALEHHARTVPPTYAALDDQQREALEAFAGAHGRKWKEILNDVYWYNARLWRQDNSDNDALIGSVLHGLRNSHGPRWLRDVYRLPKKAPAPKLILRTDAGTELGRFQTVEKAQVYADAQDLMSRSLVITTHDGVVLSRRFRDASER